MTASATSARNEMNGKRSRTPWLTGRLPKNSKKTGQQAKPSPEAAALDRELEAERQADETRSPHVAPGLRLPDDGGVILLDTFQNQPQLIELQQSSGELNKNMKGNILRATINPIASAKQTIELPGLHAKIQAHVDRARDLCQS